MEGKGKKFSKDKKIFSEAAAMHEDWGRWARAEGPEASQCFSVGKSNWVIGSPGQRELSSYIISPTLETSGRGGKNGGSKRKLRRMGPWGGTRSPLTVIGTGFQVSYLRYLLGGIDALFDSVASFEAGKVPTGLR